ncbi:GNAT family N-acetyltransferase [Kitasatospora sp. NPDC008050]|uniref:GNAT family N-acetyltransferase n=1 Tax=Kitasatospora sp. NPDC008050 TaxID=3364021 RepID=UPI0036EE903B
MTAAGVSELVRMWIDGWVVSRGASDPVAEPWGWTIDVGKAGHVARHVLPEPTGLQVGRLVAATGAPGTWLKLFADDDTARSWVTPDWELADPAYLMSCPLGAEQVRIPAGYVRTSWTRGNVVRVLIRTTDGHFAARGQLAVAGGVGVPDQIETAPAHRRRGLGGVVMRTLQNAAHQAGAETGVLVASSAGRALYTTLGWTARSPMASLCYAPPVAAG